MENFSSFMFRSRCVYFRLFVILLYIDIGMFVLWFWVIMVESRNSIVGCSGLQRCVILWFMWLMVRVYWIRLLVLMERKFSCLMNKGSVKVVVGILIMVLIGIFLLNFCLWLCSCCLVCLIMVRVWLILKVCVIIGISSLIGLQVDVCRMVCSCVRNICGLDRQQWIVCKFSVGFRVVFLFLFSGLLVFMFRVWMVIILFFMVMMVCLQDLNCLFLLGNFFRCLVCFMNRNFEWNSLIFIVFVLKVLVVLLGSLMLVRSVIGLLFWVMVGVFLRCESFFCLCSSCFCCVWYCVSISGEGLMMIILVLLLMMSILLCFISIDVLCMLIVVGMVRLCVMMVVCELGLFRLVMKLVKVFLWNCSMLVGEMLWVIMMMLVVVLLVGGRWVVLLVRILRMCLLICWMLVLCLCR